MSKHQPHPETPEPSDTGSVPQNDSDFQIANLIQERDEAIEKYQRSIADYQNYHRRSLENEREAKRQGITSVLQSIIPILDHFDLALGHKTDNAGDSQVIEGVKVIRDELIKALASHGVSVINPQPNDELDPQKHQVILNQPAANVEPGHISMTLQVGYALETRVIRPAKVAVAPTA
jgi:molecular chaperone GrpE